MTMIRIADDACRLDDSRLDGEGAISRTTSTVQPEVGDRDDNIYNIRSQARLPDRISRISAVKEQPDEDPSLRTPSDLRKKQVCTTSENSI